MDTVYMGPTVGRFGLKNGEVFKGGTPSRITQLINLYEDVGTLVVPLLDRTATQREINKKGSIINQAYVRLETGASFGGSETIPDNPVIPDVPPYQRPTYTTPVPSMLYQSDGTKVNPADGYNKNGIQKVEMINPGESNDPEDFTFADAVTAAGSKTYFATDKKTIVVTFLGPGVASFTAKLVSHGSKFPLQGVRESGKIGIVDTALPGEIVTFDKPAGSDLELSWTDSTGGSVTAKAVVS